MTFQDLRRVKRMGRLQVNYNYINSTHSLCLGITGYWDIKYIIWFPMKIHISDDQLYSTVSSRVCLTIPSPHANTNPTRYVVCRILQYNSFHQHFLPFPRVLTLHSWNYIFKLCILYTIYCTWTWRIPNTGQNYKFRIFYSLCTCNPYNLL